MQDKTNRLVAGDHHLGGLKLNQRANDQKDQRD